MRGSDVTAESTGPVAVRMLGPFEVSVDRRPVSVPSGRLRVLLAVLALHADRPAPSDQVVDAVWGTDPPANVRRTLRTYLARLRAAMDTDAVENGRSGPVLRTTPDSVDALRFLRLVDAAAQSPPTERATLVAALDLWRGKAFDGLDSPWLHGSQAARLDERRMAALERRIDLDLAGGRHDTLVAELRDLTAAHPLRESLWVRLMLALSRSGRNAEALEGYEMIRARIAAALGADPGPELRGIHAELLAGDAAAGGPLRPRPVVPRQLPADIARFTGRDEALHAIDELAADRGGHPTIVALTGIGGIGKTSLAVHWAHRFADRFPDGVLYLNLHGYGPGAPITTASALDAMLRGLGVTGPEVPADAEVRASTLRSMLAQRRILLILDNARGADQVRALLPGSGEALVLVTSRSQLRGLVAREGARRISLDVLHPRDSEALLATALDGQGVPYDTAALTELAERCGHLPLALAIAAERAGRDPGLELAELVDELGTQQDRLAVLDAGDGESTDLRAVFTWSYEALDVATARLFRRLGLQPAADFAAPSAAALAGTTVGQTRRLLDRLLDANLLQQRRTGRYELHDLVREYAADLVQRVDPAPDREAAFDRYVGWWVQTTANARKTINLSPPLVDVDPTPHDVEPLTFDDYDAAFSWFDSERPALLAVAGVALTRGRRRATYQLAHMAGHHLIHSRALDDLMALLRLGSDAARAERDGTAEAMTDNLLGIGYGEFGDRERSRVHHERALAGFDAIGHDRGQLAALTNLGSNAFSFGRMDEAAAYCERSHAVARRLGNPLAEVLPLNMLATAYISLDRPDEAVAACRTALEIAEDHDDAVRTAAVLDTLGQAHAAQGRHDEAVDSMRRSATLFGELRDRWSECVVLTNLGRAYQAIGHVDQARQTWERALAIFDEVGGIDSAELTRAELVALLADATS